MQQNGCRTFAFTLSTAGCGTTAIAKALRSIGCDAHHEILQNHVLYYRWMKGRFSPRPAYTVADLSGTLKDYIEGFLKRPVVNDCHCCSSENPLYPGSTAKIFADISHYTSCLWPLIFSAFQDVRCVHICRNGAAWVEKQISQSGLESMYGGMRYPSSGLEDREFERMNPFEQMCWHWSSMNRYFLLAKVPLFKAEKLGDRAKFVCSGLFPEGDSETFAKQIRNIDNTKYRYSDWRDYEKRSFDRICGETMAMLGY